MPLTGIERDIQESIQEFFDATDPEAAVMARVLTETLTKLGLPQSFDHAMTLLYTVNNFLKAWEIVLPDREETDGIQASE